LRNLYGDIHAVQRAKQRQQIEAGGFQGSAQIAGISAAGCRARAWRIPSYKSTLAERFG
jgi:hypothetical protein